MLRPASDLGIACIHARKLRARAKVFVAPASRAPWLLSRRARLQDSRPTVSILVRAGSFSVAVKEKKMARFEAFFRCAVSTRSL
jgi:hypothetical protein